MTIAATDAEAIEIIDPKEGWSYRPQLLEFRRPDFVSTLKFDWPTESLSGQNVRIDLKPVPFGSAG
jgi:hypothetical protein